MSADEDADPAHPSPRRAPGFALLWAGTAASAIGTFVGSLALSFAVIETLGASAVAVASLAVVQLVAGGLAAPLAGVLVDRHRRRRLMVVADLVRTTAILVLPVAHHVGHLSVWLIGCVGAVSGAGNVVFNAAYQSHLPRLVGRERLVSANATIAATVSLCEIAGFAAAGWLVQLAGAPNVLIIDALSFLVSAACIASISAPEPRRAPVDRPSVDVPPLRVEAAAGLRHVRHDPVLRVLVGTAALYDASAAMFGVGCLVYLSGDLGYPEGMLGSIFAVGGVASLVGARVAHRAERAGSVGRVFVAAGLVRTIGTTAMPAVARRGALGTGLLIGNQVVTDPAWMLQEIAEASIREARVPDDVAGRVSAAQQLATTTGRLVGTVVAGTIAAASGPRAALWAGSGLCAIASIVLALSPIRRLTRAAVAGEAAGGQDRGAEHRVEPPLDDAVVLGAPAAATTATAATAATTPTAPTTAALVAETAAAVTSRSRAPADPDP